MINPTYYYKTLERYSKVESEKGIFSKIADKIKYVYGEVKKAEELCNNMHIDETDLNQMIQTENTRKILDEL
ncbi:MAG: hypothetical protein Q7S33_00720 [Nanoarchaeota archaeon]|nr:hypothetical protein [Nanoarchaeota archaeon]